MADYSILQGPQFPFSRALTSGPIGDLLAGVFGVPGDIAQIAYPRNDPRFANIPTAPTYQQLQRGMEQQNANPPELSYSSIYSMLPELSLLLRGAPQPQAPSWLNGGVPPVAENPQPQQGWNVEKIYRDLFGGSKPAF
jgi:hypothetical protein